MGFDDMELTDRLALSGHLALSVYDPGGQLVDYRAGDNVITTGGYTALAAALVWPGIEDQAAQIGQTNATYLTPLYGAIGTGTGTPAKSNTALFTEIARQVVGAAASAPATPTVAAQVTFLFYFPQPANALTVTEAGMFAGASDTPGSGNLIDHWAFSPSVAVSTTQSLILQVSLALGP